ncbi:MAG: class II fructose-bisphosphatase [Bdellovibrionales bacterium]|nr:class II fructose-bisphosphatase [Bdellovibrionales bacterium]
MDRNLALEFVRITEAASLACSHLTGRGDSHAADQAAVDAMRKAFDHLSIDGTIVIGEGERDEAPMLYIGEKVGIAGSGAPKVDIALDPLEGTSICASGGVGALSVIAVAEQGNFLHAPDTYMDKIAVGPEAKGAISLEATPEENIEAVAKALNKNAENVTVVILDRPRHEELIQRVRKVGSRILLIGDGDVSAGVATSWRKTGIDMLLGIGGAPEGVITAAALKCLGGDFYGKLRWRSDEERERALTMGVEDPDKIYSMEELAQGDVMFVATGVTDGPLLKGVRYMSGSRVLTESVVMRSKSGTIRFIESEHDLSKKPSTFAGSSLT